MLVKTSVMESGRLPSNSTSETAAILENLGGCCEGTVFTFTSASSRWRLRQRLNRNKGSLVSAHGRQLFREDPADSVFTEMRIMPRSSESNPSNGVELWNRNKSLNVNAVRTEESSRANYFPNSGPADLRDYCSANELTRQVGEDSRGKIFSQEAVKADDERRELQLSTKEITPRKSRRYMRYESSMERHRNGDVVEEDKIWTWNEKKLEDVRAQELSKITNFKGSKPAEERRNKRESSAEEIHVFEQRKVKCRRREQDSCSTHSESVRSEDISTADDFNRASYGFTHRQMVAEESRKHHAGPVVAICPYVADDLTKNKKGSCIDSAEEMEDKRSSDIAKQNSVFELHIQRGNVTEENRSWTAPRPSTPPIACSFISFKGGVSCVGNRRRHFLANVSSIARRFPDVEHKATATCDENDIQSQILNDSRLVVESSRLSLSNFPNRNQRSLEHSFPRVTEVEGGDAQSKTDKEQRPEAHDNLKSKGLVEEAIMLSETEADNSPHTVGPVDSDYERPMSKELSSSWSFRATEGSFERGGDALSVWERSHSGISKSKQTFVTEGESGPRRIEVSQPDSPTVKEGARGRLSSISLDCHGSLQVEDDLKTTDLDGNDQRSNERESDEFIPKGEADGCSAQERAESCGDIFEGSPAGMSNLPLSLAAPNYCEPSGVPNKSVDDGNAYLEENLRCKVARNYLRKSTTLELENQSFREPDAGGPDRTQSTGTSCKSRSEIIDLDRLPQKGVPLRRHTWVKGFRKKTGEKVSYFESWLGRSKKLHMASPARKCGSKGVGELSQAIPIVETHDKSRLLRRHSIDQHLMSPTCSKKDSQVYVTKEFEILEAVLQSELDLDDEQVEEADHLRSASMKLRIVDNEEGEWDEGETMKGRSNSQHLDAVNMSTSTNLENEHNRVQSRCEAGDGSPSDCGEYPEAENSQQRHWAKMPGSWKDFSTLNSLGEEESSGFVRASNNTASQAKDCRQKEEWKDPIALPHKNSAREGQNVTNERHLLNPSNILDCGVMSQASTNNRLERCRDKDLGLFPQTKDTPCCNHGAQNTGLAGQCGNLVEKDKRNQSNKVTAACNKIADGVKPLPHLRVMNDRRDISTNKMNSSDDSVGKLKMADNFGGLATEIQRLEDHPMMCQIETKNSYPSDLITGPGSLSDAVDSPLQTESLQHDPFIRASCAVSQQVPSSVQESGDPEVIEHGLQVKSSSIKLLQGARDVVDVDNKLSLKLVVAGTDISQSKCTRRADIALNTTDLRDTSANSKSEIESDYFPSSIKAPTEVQNSGAERKKESPVNRRHKMPIIVRVRNRLASGWLLQHPLWKRVAKHKMKIGESPALATKGDNQSELHADPSSLHSAQGSTRESLISLNESRNEHAVDINRPSKCDTELTGTSMPQNLTLEAHHQTSATTENETPYCGPSRDFDTCKYHESIEGMESKPASENCAIIQQNQVTKKRAPPRSDDEVEEEQTTKVVCPDQASSVLSFAEWQNLAKGFGKSCLSSERGGAKSDSAVTSEREVTDLGKSNESTDVGELLSVVCLGNTVKEATVLGTFGDFDAQCEAPMILGGDKVERDYGGSNHESLDVCGAALPAACRGKREKVSMVSQMSNNCDADEYILISNSDTATSSFCQKDPVATAKFLEKTEKYTPVNFPANRSLNKTIPTVEEGAESEWSQGCESLQKRFSSNNQNEVLQTCSSASTDYAYERAPHIAGRMQMQRLAGDSIGQQLQHDGQSDDICLTSQVEDFLGNLSIERTVGQSTPAAPFQRQLFPGTADEEHHNKSLSNSVEPFRLAKVVAPFCPALQSTNPCGKEMAQAGGTVNKRAMEDPRMSSSKVNGWQEDPAMACPSARDKSSGDLNQWEIMEMLKLPNNQPQLPSAQGPQEFYRTGKQTNAWECCRRDSVRSHRTLCWKDALKSQSPSDLSTEDEIFLERFSATSNYAKSCELSEGGFAACSNIRIRSTGLSSSSSSDLNSKVRLLSAPGRVRCGKIGSHLTDRSVQPATLPSDVQLINSLPPSISTRSSLGEAERPQSSQEEKYESYNTFEAQLFPDYVASFDCPSPCSSVNRSLDNAEGPLSWARPCPDCLSKYEHQETCVQCVDSMRAWKHFSSPGCLPSRMTHNPSLPAQCQSLLLHPRPNTHINNTSPSSQCRCDTPFLSCRFSPPVLLRCHHASCMNAVHHHRHCHSACRCHSVPVSSDQHGKFQNTSTPSLHGRSVQCAKKDTLPPYIPLQIIQPSGTGRPLSRNSQETVLPNERHQFRDKDSVRRDDQLGGQPKSSQTKETDRAQGLVWLSPEEMNLIQQVRISSEKAMTICRHDAAACIQRHWRKYLEKKEDVKMAREQLAPASSLLTEYKMWHDHLQYSKVRQVETSLQLCGYSPKELSQQNLVRALYTTMENAARIIQRAWRSGLRNRKEETLARRDLPKDLKNFYQIIKGRQAARGRLAPSFELFATSVERIQAATEGARVRRRLKSHRLQTIIMEIKEIRMLLSEMSQEENCNSAPFLFPQLCTQLRQKILQLHAALNGKQMEARFLLRRCSARPLTENSSKSISPKPICLVPKQESVDQSLANLASGAVGVRKSYSPPLTNPASIVSDVRIAHSDPSKTRSAIPAEQKFIHTQSFVPLIQASKGSTIQLRNSSPDPPDGADTSDSSKLLQWYFLGQRTPSKRIAGQGTPTDLSSGRQSRAVIEAVDPIQKTSDPYISRQKASPKLTDPEYSLNKSFDDQPLPLPQRSKIQGMPFEEIVVGGSNASMYLTEYATSIDSIDKPKRPFLKRKSRVMPPQKLDWSKVKPMVSSRLEPELKTKLSLCKGSLKVPTKNNSKKKKANYSNVKSRLFSYEGNVSPSNSADGTSLHLQSSETSEAGYPHMVRGGSRESRGSGSGTENGRNSGFLVNRRRAASPDLMHLRRMDADKHCSQVSMQETQSVATHSSHLTSARYLQKVRNSEETAKDTSRGSCQQRPQRIRLRIVPGSKENEVGDLFVQEQTQEMWEDQSPSAHGKGKRQPSHSHRYAIFREQDARYSSRVAETTGPDCAEDDRNASGRASRKKTQEALRHEVYKYFETK